MKVYYKFIGWHPVHKHEMCVYIWLYTSIPPKSLRHDLLKHTDNFPFYLTYISQLHATHTCTVEYIACDAGAFNTNKEIHSLEGHVNILYL